MPDGLPFAGVLNEVFTRESYSSKPICDNPVKELGRKLTSWIMECSNVVDGGGSVLVLCHRGRCRYVLVLW